MSETTTPATGTPLLRLEGVGKSFPSPTGAPLVVLDSVDLELRAGESLGVVGPSGSGKSTLLNLIGALDRPSAGRVLLEGEDLAGKDDEALADVRARRIGFVFQLHHLLPQCTVLENVLLPTLALASPPSPAASEARARELLARVGLADRVTHRPSQLSGGERQRVAVARALINRPALVLADEPTGSLDGATSERVAALLLETCAGMGAGSAGDEGALAPALVVVTHAPDLAARMGRTLELSKRPEGRPEPAAAPDAS